PRAPAPGRRRVPRESGDRHRPGVPDPPVDLDVDVSPLAGLQDPGVHLRGQSLLPGSGTGLSAAARRVTAHAAIRISYRQRSSISASARSSSSGLALTVSLTASYRCSVQP